VSFLKVSEIFYSIQGEGQTAGKPAVFLRLQSCNLLCGGIGTEFDKKCHNGATWRCDTIETWLKGEKRNLENLAEELTANYKLAFIQGAHLIITGGEPLLQMNAIKEFYPVFSEALKISTPIVEIETNGTIEVDYIEDSHIADLWNVSPKLSNSGMPKEKRYIPSALQSFVNLPKERVIFKFVVSREEDINEILEDFTGMMNIDTRQVWLMPSASNREELQKNSILCVEACKQYGYNFSSRLQVQIWDKTVGV